MKVHSPDNVPGPPTYLHKNVVISVAALLGIFTLLYASTFMDLFQVWSTDEDYSHGFLIIPVSLYLVWRKRADLLDQPLKHSRWGFVILAVWAVMYFLGYAGNISTFVTYSMIVLIFGIFMTIAGYEITKMVLFPILFLLFMLPIPSEIYTMMTNPMKLVATTASVWILQLLDLPVYQEGNLIHLPNYSMQVVVACSGIRSLISIVALGLLMGYVIFNSNLRRVMLFIFSLPISVFGNVLRITITGLLAYYVSSEMAEGYSHTMAGLVTFALSFVMLLLGVYIIQCIIPVKK